MKKNIGFAPVVAVGMLTLTLTLAACSTLPPRHEPYPVAAAPAPAPPVAPVPMADQRIAANAANAANALMGRTREQAAKSAPPMNYLAGMPAPVPHSARLPESADKFPDKDGNKSVLVSEQPVSTFSVDVDTASYSFVRRMLSDGRMPPLQAVRVEEMVNYFPYNYATPANASQPFAVTTEVMPSPWQQGNQLVHVALKGYDIKAAARPRANVVLLVDISGSMGPRDRLPLLQQGFRLFAEQLRDDDMVSIVTYANGTAVALEPTSGKDKQKIIDVINNLHASGGTAGGDGLQRAYAQAERNFDPKAVNRVILATDGDFNIGITDPKQLEKFIVDKRKSGVYLSVFGVGLGNLNDALIQRLTQSGNGNAAYIDTLLEARKALAQELGSTMFPIANDVKVQVEFNPAQVAAYRLVGYETRMLNRQDFKDDKVDAGDMGAGHTVTAIYEITPAANAGKLVDPLRYAQPGKKKATESGNSDELCYVKVRYKLPGQSASKQVDHAVRADSARDSLDAAPDDQRFAVAVAAFGQRLRGEQQVADFSFGDIAKLAEGARGADREGYRAEFVKMVRMAESLGTVGATAQR
ncbi:Ca-activated chloride channel family protein [Duganella sp. CF458]|uniref:vWA domain-containing protein n=1 Tax=Duganella sp. CF458 TaxID=1884368 RepID=UPI0008EF428E|nr:VWA domain-containing protein [Duganella sp. CF458]SFF61012.1 Ca-activated chloride channel family protein [Duganella sp. CF458]